jgi:hypothetical protein
MSNNQRSVPLSFVQQGLQAVLPLLLLTLMTTPAFSAPITFNTALPVAEGEGIFRAQFKYFTAADDGPGDRDLAVSVVPLVGVYGLTKKWALFGIVPYLDKELEVNTPLGRRTREVSGLGDITLLARYTAFKQDRPGQTLRIAPFVGLETPTGEDGEQDALGRLPQPLQLGSGSWDPLLGVVTTWQTLERQIDAALSYKINTPANDFEFGDTARFDLSYQHRIWPRELGSGVPTFLYGVLEGNLIWQDKNKIGDDDDPDSGGTTLYLTPGIQRVTKRTVLETAIQIPLIQNLNGDALENDFIWTLSFRVNF